MKIKVYRPNQIGGCITVIESKNGTRIIIDVGSELPGMESGEKIDINNLTKGCAGVFLTHYHGDHTGEFTNVHPDTNIYMGEVAQKIFYTLQKRLSKSTKVTGVKPEDAERIKGFITFKQGDTITLGDMDIKPIRTDHSAFDSYMFLIDDGERQVLHTGDFRSHGKVGEKSLEYIEKNVGKVNALIIEGTMLSRASEGVDTEEELMEKAIELLKNKDHKYVFIMCSSTNIDRIASFYHINKELGGRLFVTDSYQKSVLKEVTENSAEYGDYYDFSQSVSFDKYVHFDDMHKNGFFMLVRNNPFSEKFLYSKNFSKGKLFIYSMWKGYLEGKTKDKELAKLVPDNYEYMHTSGHATEEAICRLCRIVDTPIVFPIHSNRIDRFDELKEAGKITGDIRRFKHSGECKEI